MTSPPRDYATRGRRDVMGLYRESSLCASCTSGRSSKLDGGENRPSTGRERRTLFVRGRLRRVGACALAEMYMSYTGKIGKRVHKWYMLHRRR